MQYMCSLVCGVIYFIYVLSLFKAKNRNCLHVADSPITFLGLLAAIILILFQMSELLVMEGTNALKLKAVSVL